jgi:hypothetical protein
MAIQVSSIEELKRVMMQQTQEFMNKSADNLIDEIKESIDETVYSYQPDTYNRSKDLQNTLEADPSVSGNDTQASIRVQHNTSKAGWFSVKDGQGRFDIPEIVTYGAYGTFVGEGIEAHGRKYHTINPKGTEWGKPRDYMQHAEDKLDNGVYLKRCLSSYLPSYVTIK